MSPPESTWVRVTHLELSDFRPYSKMELEVGPGLTVLLGKNGQGKTAFLESLYVLAAARSFRTSSDPELIRWGQKSGRASARLETDSGRPRKLELRWQKQGQKAKKEAYLNDRVLKKLAEFLGVLPLTLFAPEDLQLIQGGPALRRRFLDLQLSKLYPAYMDALSRYKKALRQRNELLRQTASPSADLLEPWDAVLVATGVPIQERRHRLCQELSPCLAELYGKMAGDGAELTVEPQVSGGSEFSDKLVQARSQDLRRRTTCVGPHRDDLVFLLDGRDIRRFGSQGQQRTAALCLRLAEAQLLTELGGEAAVILLDDCFSELDPGRQEQLLELLEAYPQVFVTSATPLPLPGETSYLYVEDGQIRALPESGPYAQPFR